MNSSSTSGEIGIDAMKTRTPIDKSLTVTSELTETQKLEEDDASSWHEIRLALIDFRPTIVESFDLIPS